jgi:hypothetical protein
VAYVKFGPFINGSAPGIQASFLNAVENFLVLVNSAAIDSLITSNGAGIASMPWLSINPTAIVTNGATAGNMTLYQPLRGTFKVAVIVFNGFRNGAGPAQTLVLPTAFTGRCKYWIGDATTTRSQFLLSGVAQNIAVITTLAGSGGTDGVTTTFNGMPGRSNGEILSAGWDTFSVPSGDAGNLTTILLVIGT